MLRVATRVLLCAVLLAVPLIKLRAETIVSLTSSRPENYGSVITGSALAMSWSQTNRFTNVTITAACVGGNNGVPEMAGSGTAFLTTRLGPEATTNDELASVFFLFPLVRTNVVLFTNLILEAGTYYLTLAGNDDAWDSSWAESCVADFALADGVVLNGGYRLGRLEPYIPSSRASGSSEVFFHFSVIAASNGLPVERPTAAPETNRRPVARDQFFTIEENGSHTFRFDAVDPDGDPVAIHLGRPPANGTLTTEHLWMGPYTGGCFPEAEVTYTARGEVLGEEVIEFWPGDHTGFADEPGRVTIRILPPSLAITRVGENLEFRWPTIASLTWWVEFAPSVDTDRYGWRPVMIPPVEEGDSRVIRLPAPQSTTFFRLRRY